MVTTTQRQREYLVTAYDALANKTHYFYRAAIGHRVDLMADEAEAAATELRDLKLLEFADTRARITDAGRDEVLAIKHRRQLGEKWRLRFEGAAGAIITGVIVAALSKWLGFL